jgi:hypothetical protein
MRYILLLNMDDGRVLSGNYDGEDFCDRLVYAIKSKHMLTGVRSFEFERVY